MSAEKWKVLKVNCESFILPIQATILGCLPGLSAAVSGHSDLCCPALTSNHWRSTEEGSDLTWGFYCKYCDVFLRVMCMLTQVSMKVKGKHSQCPSMMKTGPVSNGIGSLRFFDSLWLFCWLFKQLPNYQFSNGTQQTGVLEYSTEADNWMKTPWEDTC